MVICVGGCGGNIARLITKSELLKDVTIYAADSTTSQINMDDMARINYICLMADENSGSGRNRERAQAMFEYHQNNKAFDKMYEDAINAKSPVLVITSAAGGTGSGSIVPLCKSLIELEVEVIPIIICPNSDDPDAYHLNTNDLFVELEEIGITTYSMFRNLRGDANYDPVNKEVVNLVEIIFGKMYGKTNLDSIDDSDRNVILSTPGRFIAISATASDIPNLRKEITRKIFSGFQPAWTDEETRNHTFMTAYSLTSMFADTDINSVFEEINSRIQHRYDGYKNICLSDNNEAFATVIVAGLPRAGLKNIDVDFKEVEPLGSGITKSRRPKFLGRKKELINKDRSNSSSSIDKFNWT